MIRNVQLLLLVLVVLFLTRAGLGQVPTGTPPFGSFGGGPFDAVNLGNLNLHFAIPAVNKAGRGMPFTYSLSYDSSVWYPVTSNGTTSWQPVGNWGWRGDTEIATGYVSYSVLSAICPGTTPSEGLRYYTYTTFVYHDPFGTPHRIAGTAQDHSECPNPYTRDLAAGAAIDGSGYELYFYVSGAGTDKLVSTSGQVINPPFGAPTGSGTATDANGNEISVNSTGVFTDTLGQTALTVSGTGTQSSPKKFTYTSPSGAAPAYTMNFTNKNVKTNFGCSGISEYTGANVPLVSSITLPNGSQYSFTYEDTPNNSGYVTGRLKLVTLPTGGTITYTYSGGSNGITCADGSTAGLTRTLSPGGQWQYSRSGSGSAWTTTVTDPNSNQTVINFEKDSATTSTNNFYETQRVVYQGSTTLSTAITCYNAPTGSAPTPSACPAAAVASPILRTTVFKYLPNSSGLQAETDSTYDTFGLINEVDEYDYGSGAVGSLIRKTITSYATLGNGIVDRPSSVTIQDGSAHTKAYTSYGYDETAVTPTSGTPQHVSVSGSRGNLTTAAAQANGITTLYRKFTYYDTGKLSTSSDVSTSSTTNGATTTYSYSSTGSCGNSFVTSISEPLSLSRSMTWNCTGGVLTSVKDENQQTTNFGYNDPEFWRRTSVSHPDGGQTTTTYHTVTPPWNVQVSSKIDTTRNLTTTTVLDGLGRTVQQQLTSDPSGTVYTDTTYDSVGRVASVSNPYRTTSDPTYGITSYTYDTLGRITKVTRPGNATVLADYTRRATRVQDEGNGSARVTKISQSDALGRVTSVCEVTSTTQLGISPTPSACGQDIAATGFLISYQYDVLNHVTAVAQGGLNPRTYAYDMLSRSTSETNPESGTTTYTYDTATGGDLYQRTRPKPNQTGTATVTTTYTYDALHRLTYRSYNDGVTLAASFAYDQSTWWGASLQNYKGRLINHTSGSAGAVFSYDSRGRIVDEWQCSPLNCGTGSFHLHYSYDLLGDLTSTVNYTENKTYTYNYDTAARLINMQSNWNDVNHPGTLLTVNQYNALGQAQQATLGNGIVRNLQYDNRGRMTSLTDGSLYSFTLGYAPDNSILTGNDSINGNWAYIYDDFARLATSNKNSGLQTFNYKYDRYANRWQQNAPQGGPAPQYSFDANNRISGSGVVYDAAGNITNDGLGNSYTYDAEDRLLTVSGTNSASYVYDGLNKRVRATVGSNTNDYIFDQSGRAITHLVPSWHRSELYARGLHVATYVNNTTYFEHSDWLVTVRARSDVSGTRVETCTSLAFGDAQGCTGTDWSPLHFTGTESDSESNLQHFLFRQFSTTEGRWLSPDPAGLAAVNPSDPQSWNRYAYVNNNPLSFTDPTGLKMCPECHFLGGAGMGATCNLDGVSASCGEVQALMDAGATQYTFYISGTGSNRNGVSTSFGFNCNVDPGSGSVDCPGTSALPAPGGNPYWSNNAIAEILGIPSAFNLPLAGMSTLPSPLSLQQRQPVTASVRAYRPAGPVAKPGAVECITNPGDSLEALAPNANQPSADPGFPSLIYANGSGRQQLNPEGDAFGAGVAVIGDYLLAAFSCLMRR